MKHLKIIIAFTVFILVPLYLASATPCHNTYNVAVSEATNKYELAVADCYLQV